MVNTSNLKGNRRKLRLGQHLTEASEMIILQFEMISLRNNSIKTTAFALYDVEIIVVSR